MFLLLKYSSLIRLHAAVEALKQKPEALDMKTVFWNAYKPLADEFDKEFKDKYGTNLDTSLIFVRGSYIERCFLTLLYHTGWAFLCC